MSQRLFILDANALLHRAWHALPPLKSPDGIVVNAVYGVLMSVLKLIERERPDAFVACWDMAAPTFRHEAFEAYKAQREKQSDELYAQIPLLQEGLKLLGIPSLEQAGFEADDLIGSLAKKAEQDGWEVTIFTGDRDLFQTLSSHIVVQLFKKGITEMQLVTKDTVQQIFGMNVQQIIEYKILRGDTSDNIPGVKGIGEKGAKELLDRFGNLDGIMKAAHDSKSEITKRQRESLLAGEEDLPKWRMLVTIQTDAPLSWNLTTTPFAAQSEPFVAFLQRYGFRSLIAIAKGEKLDKQKPLSPKREGKPRQAVELKAMVPKELSTSDELRAWFATCHGPIALFVGSSEGGMLAPDVWLGSGTGVAHLQERLWQDKTFLKTAETCFQAYATDLVCHGAKEAFHTLASRGLHLVDVGFDTQIAAYLIEANTAEPSLEDLAKQYLAFMEPITSNLAPMVLLELSKILREDLEANELLSLFERFERPLIPVLFSMEKAGIMIDLPYLGALAHEFRAEQHRLEQEMQTVVGHAFNPASPAQLAKILFGELKLPTEGVKKGKTGFSTASSELEKLRGKHPIIEQIEGFREVAKLLSTYIDPLPTLADAHGRVHTTFHQAVTATGRLSSTDPNLQNIPIRTEYGRRIRRAFIAPPGRVLLSCDYAQIELRIVAALAKDQVLLKTFADGKDIHKTTAAAMWDVSLEQVTADQRRAAKTVNFGVLYGQGAYGLSVGAGVSMEEARDFIKRYFDVYKDLHTYLEETKAFARENGYVETFFGRRRAIPDLQSPMAAIRARAERTAINMPAQGTEADILKLAMIELAKELPKWSKTAQMLLQVHDELVFEVDEAEVKQLIPKIKQVMETVADIGVPLLVEAKYGMNWAEKE